MREDIARYINEKVNMPTIKPCRLEYHYWIERPNPPLRLSLLQTQSATVRVLPPLPGYQLLRLLI